MNICDEFVMFCSKQMSPFVDKRAGETVDTIEIFGFSHHFPQNEAVYDFPP